MAAKGKRRGKAPLDIKKLMKAMEELGEARDLPANVCVVIDVTAGDRLINCVLDGFSTPSDTTTVSHLILAAEAPELPDEIDLCVVIGGESLLLGDVVASASLAGCPAVVAVEAGETFFAETAEECIDILEAEDGLEPVGIPLDDIVGVDFDDERPLEELGQWISANVPELRASLAADFAFLRHPLATVLTEQTSLQNAGVALVIIIPGADMPVITLNQAKMVLQIASVYGQPMDYSRITEIAAVVAGAFGFRALARELVDAVPVIGWGVKGVIAYTGTQAMGRAAVEYFEEGGRINSLASAITQAAEAASESIAEAVASASEQID